MIQGKQVNLWALEPSDLLQNYRWSNNPEIIKLNGLTPIPRSGFDMQRWLDSLYQNQNTQFFAMKLYDGTYIGNISFINIDWPLASAEIGIFVGEKKYRRKGYGKEALINMTRYGFEELRLHRIYARIIIFNEDSKKFFKSCGFVKEGVQREAFFTWGKFWDVEVYSILDREFYEKFPLKEE